MVQFPWRVLASGFAHLMGVIIKMATCYCFTRQLESLQNRIVKQVVHTTTITAPIIHKFLNFSLLNNVMYLAHTEFEQVLELDNEALMVKLMDKIHVYFAHTDGWVTDEQADKILQLYKKHGKESLVKRETKHHTRHAFVIYDDDLAVISDWIASF